LHRLSPAWGVFVTLTVADASISPQQAKRRLWLLIRWLRNKVGFEAVIWKQEFQARGAVHFHLLAFSWRRRPPWVDREELAARWGMGFVWVEFFDKGRVLSYVGKYVRKPAAQPATGASPEPVPPAQQVDLTYADISEQGGGQVDPGRFWGVVGREALVWAKVALLDGLPEHLRPVFQRLLEGVRGILGFTPGVLYLFSKTYLTT
jgi:hypothetical protein